MNDCYYCCFIIIVVVVMALLFLSKSIIVPVGSICALSRLCRNLWIESIDQLINQSINQSIDK